MELYLIPSLDYFVQEELQPDQCIWNSEWDPEINRIDSNHFTPSSFEQISRDHIISWTNFRVKHSAAVEAVKVPETWNDIRLFLRKIIFTKYALKKYVRQFYQEEDLIYELLGKRFTEFLNLYNQRDTESLEKLFTITEYQHFLQVKSIFFSVSISITLYKKDECPCKTM